MGKFEAVRSKGPTGVGDWVVREVNADGRTAWIWCRCHGEASARLITESLNLTEIVAFALGSSQGIAA